MKLRTHLKTPHKTVGTFPISTTGLINHCTFWLPSTFSSFPFLLFKFSPVLPPPLWLSLYPILSSFFLLSISLPIAYPFVVYTSRHTLKGRQAFGSLEWLQQYSVKQDDGLSSPIHAERNGCPQHTLPPGLALGTDRPARWTLSSRYLSVCWCMMSAQSSALRACLISLRYSRREGLLAVKTYAPVGLCFIWMVKWLSLMLVPSSLHFRTSGKCSQNL